MKLRVLRTANGADLPLPSYATAGSAGLDLRAAAAFTFDVDAESAVLWGAPHNADRMSVISHQAYGPLVGVPRLLELLGEPTPTKD